MKTQEIRTFGRRHGKSLSAHQADLLANILPKIGPKNIPDNNMTGILEIGFGSGEHLRAIAIDNPDALVIGAEPFMNGVASLMSGITENGVVLPEYKNVRIWGDDVRMILDDNSSDFVPHLFARIYVLHPDPWPKARHEKRRLLHHKFLNLLSSRLENSGEIIIGTDHHEYYDWILGQLPNTDLKIKTTDLDIIKTRYQAKNKAGTIAPKYLVLTRARVIF